MWEAVDATVGLGLHHGVEWIGLGRRDKPHRGMSLVASEEFFGEHGSFSGWLELVDGEQTAAGDDG